MLWKIYTKANMGDALLGTVSVVEQISLNGFRVDIDPDERAQVERLSYENIQLLWWTAEGYDLDALKANAFLAATAYRLLRGGDLVIENNTLKCKS